MLTKKIGLQARAASVAENSYDEAANTVEVVFATDSPVMRSTWDGTYFEVLSMDTAHMRMERINKGAPVLDNHRTFGGLESQIGTVVRAWVEKGVAKAVLRFSKREAVAAIVQDIKDGIISNVSVGYRVYKYEEKAAPDPKASPNGSSRSDATPTYIATDWEPYEISMVAIPADHKAGVRSEGDDANDVILITSTNIERKMDNSTPLPPAPLTDEQVRGAQEAATKAERERAAAIRLAARQAGLGDEFANTYVDNGTALDAFRAAAFDELEKRNAKVAPTPPSAASGKGEIEKRREAIVAALSLRSGAVKEAELDKDLVAGARQYRNNTLLDLAKDSLVRGGGSPSDVNGLTPMELIGRAITSSTSDFPILLEGTIRRTLLAAYEYAPMSWKQFCSIGSVTDLRPYKRLRTGALSRLDKLNENAEYKNKPIPDGEFETIEAETFGNVMNVSRKMIINDDLNFINRLAAELGNAALYSIELEVFELLAENAGLGPLMQDGKTLFHADHGNLIASGGAAPTVAQFEAMRVLMAKQRDVNNKRYLNMRPAVGLFPMELGGQARVVNDAQYDVDVTNKFQIPNKVRGILGNIVDTPELSGAPYYMFANPAIEPVIEVSFLNGVQTPFMEMRDKWSVDGIEWKIRHDFGVNAVGYRGAIRNAGA